MSIDIAQINADNIKGVFADLDDGGLDESEALEQIRGLIGAEKPVKLPKRVLYTYLVPVILRVNLEEKSVESAEIESGNYWGPMPNQTPVDADTQQDVDSEITDAVEEAVKAVADDGGWEYDLQIV